MKKLTILFLLVSSFAVAQKTHKYDPLKDDDKVVYAVAKIENDFSDSEVEQERKPSYKKVVILSPNEVNALLEAMNQWKRLQVYDPAVSADESIKRIKSIDAFLIELQKNIKLDSVLVDPIKPKQP